MQRQRCYRSGALWRVFQEAVGFTLIEIMIAVALFSVGLAGVAAMQLVSIEVNNRSNLNTQLTTVAQQTVEKLLTIPVGEAALRDDTPEGEKTTYTVYVLHPQDPIPTPAPCSRSACAAETPGSYLYKVEWAVDIKRLATFLGLEEDAPGGLRIATVDITIHKNVRGRETPVPGAASVGVLKDKTFQTSFAKSNLGG